MGTPETSKIYLQTLLDNNYNIVGVYSQPSRKSGRGMEGRDSPVSSLAKRNSLPLFNPENFKSKNINNVRNKYKVSIFINCFKISELLKRNKSVNVFLRFISNISINMTYFSIQ